MTTFCLTTGPFAPRAFFATGSGASSPSSSSSLVGLPRFPVAFAGAVVVALVFVFAVALAVVAVFFPAEDFGFGAAFGAGFALVVAAAEDSGFAAVFLTAALDMAISVALREGWTLRPERLGCKCSKSRVSLNSWNLFLENASNANPCTRASRGRSDKLLTGMIR